MPLTRLPAHKVRAHRELTPVRDGGRVEVYTYPTTGTELDNIADILRRAHLEDGVPWGEMAVLVRAGSRTIPTVRRALTAAACAPGHRRRRPATAARAAWWLRC